MIAWKDKQRVESNERMQARNEPLAEGVEQSEDPFAARPDSYEKTIY